MKQYHNLLADIQEFGTRKPAARANMPGTTSLFGYQFRHDLSEGFPLLTTKRLSFNNIIAELIWFLRGYTNIKFLIDNRCFIWCEDAYNYYLKMCKKYGIEEIYTYDEFIINIKNGDTFVPGIPRYTLGDCGNQYGKTWRDFGGHHTQTLTHTFYEKGTDQLKRVIENLIKYPESRRHVVSAIDPNNDDDLALYWCHSLFQFNCRPIRLIDRLKIYPVNGHLSEEDMMNYLDTKGVPRYYLDCQMYQRSADVFLGVPYNIASYSLLTHIVAKMCNMVPGDYIHTFGDVHIYDNHINQVNEQLSRQPKDLPKLLIKDELHYMTDESLAGPLDIDEVFKRMETDWFDLDGYYPHPAIKAKLSTGLK